MKKRIFSLLIFNALLITAFSLVACNDENGDLTVSDSVFSDFTAEDFDGNIVDETIFTGYKVTMINVWGTYCAPCKKELPAFAELNAEYQNSGFQIVGIPIDGETKRQEAIQIIAATQANYRHLRVSKSLKGFISEIKSIPYTIFVNENGEQIGKAYSGAKSKSDWKVLIERMLKSANNESPAP